MTTITATGVGDKMVYGKVAIGDGSVQLAPKSFSTFVTDSENANVSLSNLLDSLRSVRRGIDGTSPSAEAGGVSGETVLKGLLDRYGDALCFQQSLLCDLEREINLLRELV